jgi:hypothetical protein
MKQFHDPAPHVLCNSPAVGQRARALGHPAVLCSCVGHAVHRACTSPTAGGRGAQALRCDCGGPRLHRGRRHAQVGRAARHARRCRRPVILRRCGRVVSVVATRGRRKGRPECTLPFRPVAGCGLAVAVAVFGWSLKVLTRSLLIRRARWRTLCAGGVRPNGSDRVMG